MKQPRLVFALFVASAFALTAFIREDDDPIKKIVAQLNKWTATNPQEKVYLQTDKPYYAAGESIWFKAYITLGAAHQLSNVSKILYVELIDNADSLKASLRLPVYSGTAWSDIKLPDNFTAGNYRIRAYTNYMRNAGEAYFFDKTIVIGNGIQNNVFTKVEYQYSKQNAQQKVNAFISFTNIDGAPYAKKEVSFEVQLEDKRISRGKGITDDKGLINIGFVNPGTTNINSGRIITNLKISNSKNTTGTIPITAMSDNVDVQFFPEGGNLITGVHSKIAFKATGANGLGANITGIITDNDNNEIAKIKTQHAGMGLFALQPQAGKTYKAQITNADGSVKTIPLPAAENNGYVLSIANNDPDKLVLKVTANAPATDELSVVAQQSGRVLYAVKSKLPGGYFAAEIPKNKFLSGIVQFTVFNSKAEPLNERIAFIQNDDAGKLNISTANPSYGPRQKVAVNLDVKDKEGKPVIGTYSVSVVDESKVLIDEAAGTSIFSYTLLSSDIKGYIEKPNYYFTNPNDQTRADLDLLMLTQGYRRFVWKQVMADQFAPMVYQPENSIVISGALKTNSGKPIAKGKASLITSAGGMFLKDTVTDEQGKFAFKNLLFADSVTFAVQGRTASGGKNVKVVIDKNASPPAGKNTNYPDMQVNMTGQLLDYLQQTNKVFKEETKFGTGDHSTMLKNVTIKAATKPIVEYSMNFNGPGNADVALKVKGKVWANGCPVFIECVSGRLQGVRIIGGLPYSASGVVGLSGQTLPHPMLVIIDGVHIGDLFLHDILAEIKSRDIESVEVLRTSATTVLYGSQGADGVLIINTKRDDFEPDDNEPAPGIAYVSPQGYNKVREFYAPRYDDPKTNAQIADLRSTIFWKPSIITNKDGKASFEFFNADAKGTYRVMVEGIDGAGNLGRQVYRYKVE